MKYQIYKDNQKLWRWSFVSKNGETIGVSSESYQNRKDCLKSIVLIKNSFDAPVEDVSSEKL